MPSWAVLYCHFSQLGWVGLGFIKSCCAVMIYASDHQKVQGHRTYVFVLFLGGEYRMCQHGTAHLSWVYKLKYNGTKPRGAALLSRAELLSVYQPCKAVPVVAGSTRPSVKTRPEHFFPGELPLLNISLNSLHMLCFLIRWLGFSFVNAYQRIRMATIVVLGRREQVECSDGSAVNSSVPTSSCTQWNWTFADKLRKYRFVVSLGWKACCIHQALRDFCPRYCPASWTRCVSVHIGSFSSKWKARGRSWGGIRRWEQNIMRRKGDKTGGNEDGMEWDRWGWRNGLTCCVE